MMILKRTLLSLCIAAFAVIAAQAQSSSNCKVLHSKLDSFYVGQCKDGLAHGKGTAIEEDIYQGELKKGLPHGKGKYIWEKGKIVFKGHFKKGKMHGNGKLIYKRNNKKDSIIHGKWKEGELTSKSEEIDPYVIDNKLSITRLSIRREAPGNSVYIYFKQVGSSSDNFYLQTFSASSGFKNLSKRPMEVTDVEFPFECEIYFRAPNPFGENIHDCKAAFTINKPGKYRVEINY
jgi:hypothetical protein